MLKTFCVLLVLSAGLVSSVSGQATVPAKATSSNPDYSQEAFVIERSFSKIKFENDGTWVRDDSARVRVQSDAGVQRFGLLNFSYEDATGALEIDYVRVRKSDGAVSVTPPENVQDMAAQITREAPFYSDLREKQVAVKGLGVGDVLEFETHQRITKPLIPGQFWFGYNFTRNSIVLQEQLEISVPLDRPIKIKNSDVKPSVSGEGGYRVYAWSTSNLERKSDQKEKRGLDKTAWEQVRGRFPQSEVLISSFQSWEEVGRWYESLQEERVKPSAEIRAKAAELTKDASDDRAKLQSIYNYVSTRFRYIGVAFGIGRYRPHGASEVLGNQYGDCKDKHTLMASLLSASGIKAYPALISSAHDVDEDVPSPGQFDHVITFVPQAGEPLWLDSTAEVGPFGYLIPSLRDKPALVVAADKPAAFVKTPADLPYRSSQAFHMEAKLSDAGALEGTAEFSARGDLEYVLRSAFRSVPLPNWKELAQRVSYGFGFGGDVSEVTAGAPEKTDEPFHFAYKYARKDFGDWANHRITVAVPAMGLPTLNDEEGRPSVPAWLGSRSEMNFHSQIELPKGFVPILPPAIHDKQRFAEYDATYSFKNGLFIGDRHLLTTVREIPPDEFEDYKNFRKIVFDDYNAFVPLTSGATLSANVPESPGIPRPASSLRDSLRELPDSNNQEAARLTDEAREAIDRKDVQTAISSLYRAVGADPKFARAWLMLGSALMAARQTEAGEEAFHKAMDADPTRPVIYKAFGYTLMAELKFEEALPVWRALVKLSPEDGDGPANLGSCLIKLKKYTEAVSALEVAVKLSPQQPNLQRWLASAYLQAGETDKAEARFRKLLELNPGADTLNNAAYELTGTDTVLPLALEYATKAVRLEEEASQKTSLAQLQADDLARTLRLSAYWDTLGFVQSEMLHLDQAEKYLTAAWVVSQDGFAASHLCGVYERLHKTHAAVRMCQLALQRLPLAAGPRMFQATAEMQEAKSRLEHISPGSGTRKDLNSVFDEIAQMRRFNLARLVPGTASADFFVLLVSDSKTSSFRVQEVKFISGSEKIKTLGKTLTSINFNFPAPDAVPTRLIRRGILGCYQYSGCSFILLDPGSVQLN